MSGENNKKPTVLLVDEDSFLLSIYAERFLEAGWEVRISQDVSDCLEKLEQESPDITILDMMIGDTPGIEALKKMHQSGLTEDTMTIILTNHADDSAAKEAKKLGACRYMVKAHHAPGEVVERVEEIYKDRQS